MKFNEAKTAEAAAFFIKNAGGKMSYMGLLKFLYVADRLSLTRRGRTITGDTYHAMQFGPVLSRTKDLILDRAYPKSEGFWTNTFERDGQYDLKLRNDPGGDHLSPAEGKIIDEVFNQFHRFAKDQFGFAKYLHKHFAEIEEVEPHGRKPLPIEKVLEGNANSAAVDGLMRAELKERDALETFFEAAEMAKHE